MLLEAGETMGVLFVNWSFDFKWMQQMRSPKWFHLRLCFWAPGQSQSEIPCESKGDIVASCNQ